MFPIHEKGVVSTGCYFILILDAGVFVMYSGNIPVNALFHAPFTDGNVGYVGVN